jgi:hypothetical protein
MNYFYVIVMMNYFYVIVMMNYFYSNILRLNILLRRRLTPYHLKGKKGVRRLTSPYRLKNYDLDSTQGASSQVV